MFRGFLQPTYHVVLLYDIVVHSLERRFLGIWGAYGALIGGDLYINIDNLDLLAFL